MAAAVGFKILGSLGIMASTTAATIVGGAVILGTTAVVANSMMPKMPDLSGVGGNLNQKIDPIGSGEIVYGEVRKAGTKTFHSTTGDGKYYHYFLTFAMHECESIGDIYINDKVANWASGSEGFVTGAGPDDEKDWASKIYIK